jgi:hypothetical protein
VKTEVVELARDGTQARFHIAQTLSMSQLSEGHTEPLLPAGKPPQPPVSPITDNTPLKFAMRNEVHQLGENHPALIHIPLYARRPFKSFHRAVATPT